MNKEDGHVYPVGPAGRYHWPITDTTSLDGLYSLCGRVRLDADRGRPPGEIGPFQRCHHRACRVAYDLAQQRGVRGRRE